MSKFQINPKSQISNSKPSRAQRETPLGFGHWDLGFPAEGGLDTALAYAQARSLLPTTGASDQLQKLKPAIKRRALWSATVDLVEPLQVIDDSVASLVRGEKDMATVRLELMQLWRKLGYQPDDGDEGGLRDLGSYKRTTLQLETNADIARNYGHYATSRDEVYLDMYPAQEFFRVEARKDERDWPRRWMMAGGQFYGGRMIALKTDDIWERLGDSRMFPDGLDNPWPPFAFNSGMDVRDISRDEPVALGMIAPGDILTPPPLEDINASLIAKPDVRSALLRTLIEATGLGAFDGKGVFHFTP